MKRYFWLNHLSIALTISALLVITAAWQGHPGKSIHTTTDTIPDKNKKIKDIDDALDQIEKSKQELERTLQSKDWDREMKEALDKVHFDADKMKVELKENVDKLDLQEMKGEIARTMKQIDAEKIKAGINTSIAKIDMDKIKVELDKVKDIDFKEMKESLKKMKPEIEKSMQDAKESIEKAKKEMLEYKNFIDGLDKDGLINKKENYTIEYRNGSLSINGKMQSAEVVKKYNEFLKAKKDFSIKKNDNGFDIDNH